MSQNLNYHDLDLNMSNHEKGVRKGKNSYPEG
jgi:hypothetical protein